MTTAFSFICMHCIHRTDDATCPAFPDGILLEPMQPPFLHDEVLPNQVGTTVYESDGTREADIEYEYLKDLSNMKFENDT